MKFSSKKIKNKIDFFLNKYKYLFIYTRWNKIEYY